MDKTKFMQSTVPLLYGSLLVKEQIAWHEDSDFCGSSSVELAREAIQHASALWEVMKESGLTEDPPTR